METTGTRVGCPGAAPPRLITRCGAEAGANADRDAAPLRLYGPSEGRVQAIALVFRWRGMPESEAFATIIEEVAAEIINSNHASRMLGRTLLAPQTVEANVGA